MKKSKRQNTSTKVAIFAGAAGADGVNSANPRAIVRGRAAQQAGAERLLTVDEAKELKAENETNSVADFNAAMNSRFPMPDWVTSYKLSGDFRGRL